MKKIIIFLFIVIAIMGISTINYAKYIIEYINIIAKIEIDAQIPQIELIDTKNNNLYNKYANNTHTITMQIKVTENNIKENYFNKQNVKVIVGEKEVFPEIFEIKVRANTEKFIIYEIKLNKILGDGELKLKVEEGTIIDISDNKNEEIIITTNILIDNTAPIITFLQENAEEGKILANLHANEKIREINGWNMLEENNSITKKFDCNTTYPILITDYAQNNAEVQIEITKAANIIIEYGACNQKTKWSFGNTNGKIAGEETVLENGIETTEIISFYLDGFVEKDFVQIQTYIHTYWGEGIQGIGYTYENKYKHGYNPAKNVYATLKNGDLAYVNRRISLILGGDGVNNSNNKGIGGNPIPVNIANQYLFGISGINMKLKEGTENSIVYQIWVKNKGWQPVASDGKETIYDYNKPIGGYRMSIVPKTERQYIIDYWNKDVNV